MTTRESLKEMIDDLPDADLAELEEWLLARERPLPARAKRPMTSDEFRKFLEDAPEDDEPLTEEELEALRRWRESPGPTVPHEEVKRMLGL